MALRRVLPSRATPDKTPESTPAAVSKPLATPEKLPETPVTPPQDTQSAAPVQAHADAFAAAATSAFGTLPTAPARVLEDSFTVAPQPQPEPESAATPAAEPAFTAPAWDAPAADTFTAPAWDTPATPAAEATPPAAPEPASEPAAEPAFTAPAWDVPAAAVTAPAVQAAPMPQAEQPVVGVAPEPVAVPEPAFSAPAWDAPAPVAEAAPALAPAWEVPAAQVAQPAPVSAEPAASPAAAPVTDFMPAEGAASPFEPSRPDNSSRKRRVREKRPRDFTAMGAPESSENERPKPNIAFASHVPINNKSLDKVDEDLIASGIVAPPPSDSLTSSLPTGSAESEFVGAAPQPEIRDIPVPTFTPQAAAPVVAAPEPVPAPVAVPEPAFVTPPSPMAPELPDEPIGTPIPILPAAPKAEEPVTPPSFTLSNTPSVAAEAPLPPPQSDLPWTQAQSAAEWEIEAPQQDAWMTESAHPDAAASTPAAAHMPPPAQDLYKTMGTGSAPILPPMGGGMPPRSNSHFTPEIPSQRRKQAGTPWALIAVGAVVAVGAGAYYMRSGTGNQQAQKQLATLTTPAQNQPVASNGLLPPPSTENVSFYTPPATSPTDISSTAMVAFADVPASEAGQPIVATGNEKIPDDMSFFGKVGQEIERIKAEKDGGIPAATSSTALPTPAAVDAAASRQNIQDEIAAYRSALAQSPNPAALTPSAFKRDPDAYMDGKPQQAEGTPTGAAGTDMASGSLLPPPDLYTNNPKNLPVVAEPTANAPQRIRTLADFGDIEPYMPEREKVEIPKNLKPKMAATDFPSLEVLSFVPGKGIVAFADGREGVLLIGESINGWELVAVTPDNAEFKTGQKSYQVTAEN